LPALQPAREERRVSDVAYWIGFNRVPGVGPARFRALLDFFGNDLSVAWEADSWTLARAGLDRRTIESIEATRPKIDLDRELGLVEKYGVTVLTWADAAYPRLLREIPASPPVLYVRGELTADDEWCIGVVGTRKVTAYGRQVAEKLTAGLAEAGLTIVSGLALGVDRLAHQTALDVGGRTIAVLANGVEQPYPAANRKLAEAIVAEGRGALVSDYPIGTRPEAANFPPRNRIISGLSLGTLVIEAGERSGALITARNAIEQGREVFAVPGNVFSAASEGTNDLISQGATPALSAEGILRALDVQMAEPQKVVRQVIATTPQEDQLLAQLGSEPLHIDEIGRWSGVAPAQLSGLLALMELKGLVRQVGAMMYVRA
jgi:DNA processing protein